MKVFEEGDTLAIILEKGERIIESLKKATKERNVFGFFTGIGAVSWAEIAFGNPKTGEYETERYEEGYEITSLVGNVTVDEKGDHVIHAHITLGDRNHRVIAGHLIEGEVSITCEVFLKKSNLKLRREPIEGFRFKPIKDKVG